MKERRRAYLRAGLRSRAAFWALFLGTTVTVVGGAAIGDWRIMAGGPALTALAVFLVAYGAAGKRAESEFFAELAPQLGLAYTVRGQSGMHATLPITPLLAAGDRQRFEHTMEGPLFGKLGGPPCLLGHYTFETRHEADDVSVYRPHPFTVCAIDVGAPLERFRGLYLRPRLSGLGLDHDWLSRAPKPDRVELESARFNEVYDLRRSRDQDEFALRELFSPSFIVWLSEHPLRPGFECKAGTLVVFIRGHEESAGKLTLLHEAARAITRRLGKQVEEGGSAPHFSAAGQMMR
jgi:hypothetical protein